MSLFSRLLPGVRIDDPVLGRLAPADDGWTGEVRGPHGGGPIALTVHRSTGPSDADRDNFLELDREYDALLPEIEVALYALWLDVRDDVEAEDTDFGDAATLFDALSLQGIGLHTDGHIELVYGFEAEAHPDGAFFVAVRGDRVEPVEYVE